MGNWKVLGEVPDSDDEALYGHELQTESQTRDEPIADPATQHETENSRDEIWSVLRSSPHKNGLDTPTTASPPCKLVEARTSLSTILQQPPALDVESDDEVDIIREDVGGFTAVESSPFPTTPVASRSQSVQRPHKDRAVSSAAVAEQPPSSPLSSLSSISSVSESATFCIAIPVVNHPREYSPSPPPVLPDSPPDFRLGFVRSLRPRKPIQQHPYLLENARYTQFMKSHGVKPVRTAYNHTPGAGAGGDDSQEQDFADGESQDIDQHSASLVGDTQPKSPSSQVGFGDDARWTPSPRTSTPARQLPTSSRGSLDRQTDRTSLPDEDDFPSPKAFVQRRRRRLYGKGLPQDPANKSSSGRSETAEAAPRDTPKPAKWIPVRIELSPTPSRPLGPIVESRELTSPPAVGVLSSALPISDTADNFEAEDLRNTDSSDVFDSAPDKDDDEDQSGSDVVRRSGRRIPASWLMLDQRRVSSNTQRPPTVPRRTGVQADYPPRKGLALPRRHSPGTTATTDFIFDESDDDIEAIDGRQRASEVVPWPEDSSDEGEGNGYEISYVANDFDDTESVVEEDVIDRMISGTKRKTFQKRGPPKKKQRTGTSGPFKGTPGQKTRQPKITKMLRTLSQTPASSVRFKRHIQRTHSAPQHHRSRPPADRSHALLPAPSLSILDLVEPVAPDFVRIAARTARSRTKLGKTSPSRKIINLGSRGDNIDALSVLHDWKSGKLKPRIHSALRPARQLEKQQPLKEMSLNHSRLATAKPKGTNAAHALLEGSLQRGRSNASAIRFSRQGPVIQKYTTAPTPRNGEAEARPALLETVSHSRLGRSYFISKKKELDEMYRRRRKDVSVLPNVHLERFVDGNAPANMDEAADDFRIEESVLEHGPGSASAQDVQKGRSSCQSRFRKRYAPKLIDTAAPRFVHALDPIPFELGTVIEAQPTNKIERKTDKLLGLGPFGSQYSQHFDIFPLDNGVFFSQSTLLGSGRLSMAIGTESTSNPRSTFAEALQFQLDSRSLRWMTWDDNASSEFGILFDWLAELLHPTSSIVDDQTCSKVTQAVNYILDFIHRVISVPDISEETQRSFILRSLDVLSPFTARLEDIALQREMQAVGLRHHLNVLSGTLLISVWILRLCRDSSTCLAESFQSEELLKRIAKLSTRILLRCGLENVRSAYGDLQQPLFRERGIRGDMQTLASWAILMQGLGYARLPRAGFWDILYSVMLDGHPVRTCTDARSLERIWGDMFTLLPLGEIDSSGVVQAGLRHLVSFDGWTLPREALSRVFQMYETNPRQSPSFNAYCRALLGRCHYLVKEWGWQRCSSVVGVIFDFYGRQDFAHLRNEEAHTSPRFLEELADSPSLDVGPDDKCFHIFIKMLGLVILRLRRLGLANELRNLITRTLPNHNRQYLKEQDIHSGDLAALRNHHDLLCTLFWAAPPELRPGVHLIEKLVMPGSSHKEACIINIRAWNQLARFVVATGEDYNVYKAFASWMNSIFQQVLEQFLSVESDMEKQLLNLSENMMNGISPHILKAMAAKNRAASMDVLHACIAASLDVLKHTRSLEMATYCFSSMQLEAVFTKIDPQLSGSDWGVLQTALDIVAHYLERVEKAMDEQYSSSLDDEDAHATEEAIMMLDHKLAKSLFHLNNSVTRMAAESMRLTSSSSRMDCAERCVVLSARLASRFIHSGVYRLSRFFGSGDRSLFERLPHAPGLAQRKFLPLFLAAMIQNNVFDFKDIGSSLLELWMLAIVKPEQFLAYEIRLAETLKRHDLPYLRKAFVPTSGQAPSYDTNRAFFACALSSMRLSLQEADSARRQQLRGDFAKALKLVMRQMKEDLKYTRADAAQHERYVGFVRSIVALIKSHGGDICPLDAFYYQQSQDYSPSVEDPQLQTAGIIAYGLRLGEGEATAAPQLFHYLHNNFNIALANNQLSQECEILERGMDNGEVLRFMFERLLPAIIRATSDTCDTWPMLAVYSSALQSFLTRCDVPKDIGDENMAAAVGVMDEILAWLRATAVAMSGRRGASTGASMGASTGVSIGIRADTMQMLSCAQVHVMAQLTALANVLQPVLMTCSFLRCSQSTRAGLDRTVRGFHSFATRALAALKRRSHDISGGERGEGDHRAEDGSIPTSVLLGSGEGSILSGGLGGTESCEAGLDGVPGAERQQYGAQVDMFRKMISRHVRENWAVGDGKISVRKAGARQGAVGAGDGGVGGGAATAMPPGTAYGPWTMGDLLDELQRQICGWKLSPPETAGTVAGNNRRLFPGRRR